MQTPEIYAVIMAGGTGTRFWPASRIDRPKQFLPIAGRDPMITETWNRLEGLVPAENILVVTAESQAALVRECLPDLPEANLLAEPMARNTAPCVALAAFEVQRRSPSAVQVVLPADHVIRPAESFRTSLRAAVREAADSGALLTFGIQPTFPATGYGYIEAGARLRDVDGTAVHDVVRFVEKPDRARAEAFLAQGGFLWNSGIFVWSTAAILAAVKRHIPAVHAGLERVQAGADLAVEYAAFASDPVDVAILERADKVHTIPIDYEWNDVGSWAALPDLGAPDADGNWSALGGGAACISIDSEGCVAYVEGAQGEEVVAVIGLKDLVVVRAGNATLVCPRDRAQDVKRIVERLKSSAPQYL